MKWAEARALVVPNPGKKADGWVLLTVDAWANRYRIHRAHRFVSGGLKAPGCAVAHATSLSGMTLASKLIIVAHGNPHCLAGLSPKQTVDLLYSLGLRQVGLLSFKSCEIGAGDFLDQVVDAARHRIQIGWCIGYKDIVRTAGRNELVGSEWRWRRINAAREMKRSDERRVKVVRGNVPVLPPRKPSTRYMPLPLMNQLYALGTE